MLRLKLVIAAGLVIGAPSAFAAPSAAFDAPEAVIVLAHHKPWHHGGPPWMRDRGRYDERAYRDDRYDRRAYRREVCRTRYEDVYDRYTGVYVTRPVRVCSSRY
jgi:hypothetical protein